MAIASQTAKIAGLALAIGLMAAPSHGYQVPRPDDGLTPSTRVICRTVAPPTGTRLGPRRICKTQADWDANQAEARREVQQQQDRGHFSFGE